MGEEEKEPPEASTGPLEGVIHIHILMNYDDNSFVTTISHDEYEDWSEHINENE